MKNHFEFYYFSERVITRMVQKISGNIAETSCSVMVNAANGVGYMGGKRCAKMLCRGVSETMQFATHGLIEKDAGCAEDRQI